MTDYPASSEYNSHSFTSFPTSRCFKESLNRQTVYKLARAELAVRQNSARTHSQDHKFKNDRLWNSAAKPWSKRL